jgi:hypothetical protein
MAEWRVGKHYGVHLYEGEVPLGTMLTADLARQVARDHNTAQVLAEQYMALNSEVQRQRVELYQIRKLGGWLKDSFPLLQQIHETLATVDSALRDEGFVDEEPPERDACE